MQTSQCEQCHQPQPRSWASGDACVHCGGVVRVEQRCASCLSWTPPGFCRGCGTETVSPSDFGAVRMLLVAGVDRFSVKQRLLALDDGQRETLASRYATQWAWAQARVDEVAACQRRLLHQHWAAATEEQWLRQLPNDDPSFTRDRDWPLGPFGDDDLPVLESRSDGTGDLAAIAMVRLGHADGDRLDRLWSLSQSDGELGEEAVAALFRPRCWWWHRHRNVAGQLHKRLEAMMKKPSMAVHAAIGLAMLGGSRHSEVADALKPYIEQAITDRDDQLRLAAAILLRRADMLVPWLEASTSPSPLRDQVLAALPEQHLATWIRGLPSLPAALQDADVDGFGRSMWRTHSVPLLQVASQLSETSCKQIIDNLVHNISYVDLDRFSSWWSEHSGLMEDDSATRALAAVAELVAAPTRTCLPVLRPFIARGVDVFTRELARNGRHAAQSNLAELLLRHGPLSSLTLSSLWQEQVVGRELISHLFSEERRSGDGSMLEVFAHWWTSSGDAVAYERCLTEATERHGNGSGAEKLQQWCWHRLMEHEAERPSLWRATVGWHDAMVSFRDAQTLDSALRPRSAALWFRLYGGLNSPQLWETTKAARAHADEHDGHGHGALLDAVFDLALPILARHPRQALASCFQMAMAVADPFCDEPLNPHLAAAAQRLRARFPELQQTASAGIENDNPTEVDALHFIEDIEVRIRMMDEAIGRLPPTVTDEHDDDDDEDVPQDISADSNNDAPMTGMAIAQMPTEPPPAAAASSTDGRWRYTGDPLPVDTAILVNGPALATLVAYVGFIVGIQRGGDVMKMFADHGIDPPSWGVIVTAWGSVLSGKPELAMRMAMLMQGTWVQLTELK